MFRPANFDTSQTFQDFFRVSLGNVHFTRGELNKAIELYEKSLELENELKHMEGMANQYANLGSVYQTRGDLDRAIGYYEKSLTLFQQLGAKDKVALVQSWIDKVAQENSN